MTKKISVVINTKNAAETLEHCLQSVSELNPEIVVVDMHSSDETITIAKKYKAAVFSYKDIGYADPARNFALSKASSDWILVLDADEYVTSDLVTHIKSFISRDEADIYAFPRKNIIFDTWIEHSGWWPDYQIRLFKKGTVSWEVGVHKRPVTLGRLEHLPAKEEYAIHHNNYLSIEAYIERLQRYTTLTAQEDSSEADDFNKTSIALKVIRTFRAEFFGRLFANKGLKDKSHGVILALLQSFYQLSTLLKIWQKHGFKDTKYHEKEILKELSLFTRELQYWVADWRVHNSSGFERLYWRIRRKYRI